MPIWDIWKSRPNIGGFLDNLAQIVSTPTELIEEYPIWSILMDHMEVVSMPNDSQIQFMAIKQVNGAKYCPGIKASPEEYANDQFEEMITSINSGTFQPDQDVCGTYLCSEPSTKWTKSKVSWFRTGQIDMADMSVIQEHLPRALKKEKPLCV